MKTALLLIVYMVSLPLVSGAQLCAGSSGDPIVNITFGTHYFRLRPGETDFELANGCPTKGTYTITGLIFGCGDNRSWLTVAGDHTGDVGGNYMLINAESWDGVTTPALIHRDTATGLCSSVTYVYSAWATGVTRRFSCDGKAVPANLFFKVTTLSGKLIASFDAGNLPQTEESLWRQYGLSFTMPPGETTAVVSTITIRKFGCGQGFAIDDITLKPCGPQIAATVNGSADPLDVCADFNKPFQFQANYAEGFTNPSAQWQNSLDSGKTWNDIPQATSTSYSVMLKDTGMILYRLAMAEGDNIHSLHCRIVSNVLYTNVHPLRPHQLPQNVLGCLGKDLLLPKRDPFASASLWTGPNGYTSNKQNATVFNFSYADTGLYELKQNFLTGCSSFDSFYVHAFPSTTVSVAPTFSICEGQSIMLPARGDGHFLWQPGTGLSDSLIGNPIASPHDTTLYQVMLTNEYGCKDSALVIVYVYHNPTASAGADRSIVRGDTVALNGNVGGTHINYYWTPPLYMDNNKSLTPQVSPPSDIQYTLTAQSTLGCGTANSSVHVKVYNDVFIPNSFSPNNDGLNDVFKIVAADGYRLVRFEVFNRWGQMIFSGDDISKGWDGNFRGLPQPQDTYVYILEIRSPAGRVFKKNGSITLIR